MIYINLDIYRTLIGVVFYDNEELTQLNFFPFCVEREELCKELFNLNGMTLNTNDGVLICIRKGDDIYPTICHEALHATHYVLNDRGIEIGENAESYAYVTEYLYRQITEQWRNLNGEK